MSRSSSPASSLLQPGRRAGAVGLIILLLIALPCFLTLPWSIQQYDQQSLEPGDARAAPSLVHPMGTDDLGRSMVWRCLLGGAVSLGIG
ncbi:MAG: hypothetical protein R3336_07450, partial [Phycisphaeraceae bacterium]|nr:hypothetical protein [Phycisphaeraceae bacterium]